MLTDKVTIRFQDFCNGISYLESNKIPPGTFHPGRNSFGAEYSSHHNRSIYKTSDTLIRADNNTVILP